MDNEIQKFSDDPEENLRMENQFLRMKLKAEYGSDLEMPMGDMPPEIENQFLKNIFSFEKAYEEAEFTTVYKRVGEPAYKKANELSNEEVHKELQRLLFLMQEKGIVLDVLAEYESRVIYEFITNELFAHDCEANVPAGMMTHFTYEEFHPNHAYDICQRTVEFLSEWREQKLSEQSWEIADQFIMPDGRVLSKQEGIKLINNFFNSFVSFTNWQDGFDAPHFQFMPDGAGLANVDGAVQYDAVMENGETTTFKGPLKLYLSSRGGDWWQIFLFHIPGFSW